MASANFSRREQARFCAIAQAGKARRDFGKSQIDVPFDVLAEHCAGPHFADDPFHLWPQVARVGRPTRVPGAAERLGRITGREDINAAAPRAAIKGFEIVPNKRWLQGRVFHPGHESGRSMGFPLDVTNSPVSGFGDAEPKVEPAISGAQREAAKKGMYSHKVSLRWLLIWRSEKGSASRLGLASIG